MVLTLKKSQQEFEPILINGDALEYVKNIKLMGLNISSDMTWNIHINETIKKASMRLYFLVQLKTAKIAHTYLGLFYSSCIRSKKILEYAVPVFHYNLPKYLNEAK